MILNPAALTIDGFPDTNGRMVGLVVFGSFRSPATPNYCEEEADSIIVLPFFFAIF